MIEEAAIEASIQSSIPQGDLRNFSSLSTLAPSTSHRGSTPAKPTPPHTGAYSRHRSAWRWSGGMESDVTRIARLKGGRRHGLHSCSRIVHRRQFSIARTSRDSSRTRVLTSPLTASSLWTGVITDCSHTAWQARVGVLSSPPSGASADLRWCCSNSAAFFDCIARSTSRRSFQPRAAGAGPSLQQRAASPASRLRAATVDAASLPSRRRASSHRIIRSRTWTTPAQLVVSLGSRRPERTRRKRHALAALARLHGRGFGYLPPVANRSELRCSRCLKQSRAFGVGRCSRPLTPSISLKRSRIRHLFPQARPNVKGAILDGLEASSEDRQHRRALSRSEHACS